MVAAAKTGASDGASSAAVESTVATALSSVGVQFTISCATLAPEQPAMEGNSSRAISAHTPSLAVEPDKTEPAEVELAEEDSAAPGSLAMSPNRAVARPLTSVT